MTLIPIVFLALFSSMPPPAASVPASISQVEARQERVVTGRVIDAAGQGLAGVQVVVEGTSIGTLSDGEGRFRLANVPAADVRLMFISIGYRTRTSAVPSGMASVTVTLDRAAIALDEIVVTATAGATQRRELGNALTSVRAAEVVAQAAPPSLSALINARAPGVVVNSGPGVAGAGSRILIRGRSSVSLPSDPLIYVDGVRVDNAVGFGFSGRSPSRGWRSDVVSRLDDIPPDHIESIEIIRGPAAATLYGTEAANGVIQIITKRGRGDRPSLEVRSQVGASYFNNLEDRWPVIWARNPATGDVVSWNQAATETARGTPLFRTALLSSNGGSLSGTAGDRTRYFVGLDYDRNEGTRHGHLDTRFSGRLNVTIAAAQTLDVQGSAGLILRDTELPGGSELPTFPAGWPLAKDGPSRGDRGRIPHDVRRDYSTQLYDTQRFIGSLQFEHRPVSWLTQRLITGLDLTTDSRSTVQPVVTPAMQEFYRSQSALDGYKRVYRNDVSYVTLDYSLSARFNINPEWTSTTSTGFQYYRRTTEITNIEGYVFPTRQITALRSAGVTSGWDDFIENTTVGGFIQQAVGWKNRLFLTAALRGDDNSAFGTNFDAVIYPKVGASWVVSEEPFWNLDWVDALRLRMAWGASGQQPDAYSATRTYRSLQGPGGATVLSPSVAGNPDLKPERGEEWEGGFEVSLFQDRIGLDFTVYDKRTKDGLVLANVAPSTGYATGMGITGERWINGATIRNRGFEVALVAEPVRRDALRWSTTFSFSQNDNKLLELAEGLPEYLEVDYLQNRHQPGYPLTAFFRRHVLQAELGPAGRIIPESAMCDDGKGGMVSCSEAPNVYRGRPSPKYEGAFGNTISLFQYLRLYALVDFKAGHRLWNVNRWVRCGAYGEVCHESVFPEEYDPAYIAELQLDPSAYIWETIEDASYAKLREVSLSVDLPLRLAARLGATRAAVTLAGRNLRTWTNYSGFDPEGAVLSHRDLQEEDNTVPPMRSFTMTIRLSF